VWTSTAPEEKPCDQSEGESSTKSPERLEEMSEELTSTDAKSEMGRRMCRVMIVKEARAGDRRRSQKIVECRKCVVCT